MFFKIALTAATLALSAGAAAAIPGWTVTGLTIHQNAGAWYPVLGTVPPCTSVEVERYEGGWVRIGWQGQWGWVPHDYLRDSNSHCQGAIRVSRVTSQCRAMCRSKAIPARPASISARATERLSVH